MSASHTPDIASVVDEMAKRSDIPRRTADVAHLVAGPGCLDWPALHLDDVSRIPFLDGIVGVERYQLRARVRCRTGDVFVAACDEVPGYEAYNQEVLGLGAPRFVRAEASDSPIEVSAAIRDSSAFDELVQFARDAGRLAVHPYMGSEPLWDLAEAIRQASDVPVCVVAPPPAVTWFANDKRDLSAAVEAMLGPDWIVETTEARDPAGMVRALRDMATRHGQVALKMTRCASAMGNGVFDSADLLAESAHDTGARVQAFLDDKQWERGEDVLIVAWLATDCSPSTQLWIPHPDDGVPTVDGVYEQLLLGEEKVFLGSVPSRLGAAVDRSLSEASLAVARVLQGLGYVGRCSFDFIIPADGQPRFVECNGRWGGTSTPMHLMDRLFPTGRPAYRAQDVIDPHLVGCSFDELRAGLGEALYDPRTGRGRYVLYNVGCLEPYGKFDIVAIGDTVDEASAALRDDLPRRLAQIR